MYPATLTELWALTANSIKSDTVRLALESALFDHLAEPLPVEQLAARTLLDVGGGPGLVAIGLTQSHPRLQGVIYDLPQTAAVAQANIAAAGLTARLTAASGDFTAQPFANGYADIIWCSSFLHFVDDIAASAAQLFNALAPGGVLVAVHAEIAGKQEDAAAVLPFYLPLLLRGRAVTREGELATVLCDAGFASVETRRHQPFPMAPLTVLIARKRAS